MTDPVWRIRLLGTAQVGAAGQVLLPLERKAAALLAYLALEGPTRRSQLTELLWPETREAAARNNLVHLLRKLRSATGAEVVTGGEILSLTLELVVDVLLVGRAFEEGDAPQVLAHEGDFLQGLTYDDCPELGEWVDAQREHLRGRRVEARRKLSAQAEEAGQYGEALRHAGAVLDLDPLSEDAWRRVMRLHYLLGDRPAALRAYGRCKEVLWRELGVEPLPQTANLARQIDQGRVPEVARPARVPDIPLAVLRPPVLVGREREWARMEEAWARGQFIFVSGEPGVGKTRLARDFVTGKGEFVLFEGRPGDAHVPGATSARNFRTMWRRRPNTALDPWVRLEMSRYLPELAAPGEVPPPLTSHADLVRFRQAMGEFARALHVGHAAQLVDDWQFFDDLSVEDGMSFFGASYPLGQPGGIPHIVVTFRRGELSEAKARLLEQLLQQDMAVRLELQPLPDESQELLFDQIGVPEDEALRSRLASYAGGNPLFLLETIKHLIESRALGGALPTRLLPPGKVEQLIARRLSRLPTAALQAARAAAVLQRDFSVELVADVLGAPLLDTVAAWEELEAAQVTQGERFSHDLMYEAVRAGIPDTVRRLLHRSAARALAAQRDLVGHSVPAARVAHHWLEGGQDRQAVPWLMEAARASKNSLRLLEAAAFFRSAAEAARRAGDGDLMFEAYDARAETLGHLGDRPAREEALRDLSASARTPLQEARAEQRRAELHLAYNEAQETGDAARRGLAALKHAGGTQDTVRQRATLEACSGTALWLQGHAAQAADATRRAVEVLEPLGEPLVLAPHLSNLGVMLDHLDRHREATVCHRRACDLFGHGGDPAELSGMLHNLAVSLLEQGEARSALGAARRAHELESRTDGDPMGIAVSHSNLGKIHATLGEYSLALRHYDLARRAAFESPWYGAYFSTLTAETWLALGRADLAGRELLADHDWSGAPPRVRARGLVARGLLAGRLGAPTEGWFAQAEDALGDSARPMVRANLALARARFAAPPGTLAFARDVLDFTVAGDLFGVRIAAHARAAHALLALGRPEEALIHAREAGAALDTLEPEFASRGEVLAVIARTLGENREADADVALALAGRWVRDTAECHIPSEAHASFLELWEGVVGAGEPGRPQENSSV